MKNCCTATGQPAHLGPPASATVVTRLLLALLLALPGLARAQTTSFACTGGTQSYVVPAGITQLAVVATGAYHGAVVQATVAVTPGESLRVEVGGTGSPSGPGGGGNSIPYGYNGGGGSGSSGRGGGATDLRRTGTSTGDYLTSRNALLVAGGGGAEGYSVALDAYYAGGSGGTPTGANGYAAGAAYAGGGATSTAAGAGATGASAGAASVGGTNTGVGGSGGGGYYGGGGGGQGGSGGSASGGGGGGGSSWVMAGSTTISYSTSAVPANGAMTITAIAPTATATPAVSAPANSGTVTTATPTYSGTAPAGSTVRLYVDGSLLGTTTTATAGGTFSLGQPTALAQGSHSVAATAQASGQLVSASSATSTFTVVVVPVISSFAPTSGPVGTSVTITGTGFNTVAGQNVVLFGATRAAVTAASATSLSVTVPPGTTYQYPTVTNLANALTAYARQPFVVTLSGAVAFAAKASIATGSSPVAVSIGDVDGDGRPDLVSANYSDNTVSVLRNTSTVGTVSFAAKVDFATGSSPIAVSVGDVDGDGRPDLAVVNYSSSTVSVLRNTSTAGTVSFAARVDFAVGSFPRSVSIGDVDGDGQPDLVVANSGSATVSVLRNTGTTGTVSFATKADFATGTSPRSVSMGDVDGDGRPDLAVGNYSSATVSVLRNTGAAGAVSFAPKADFATGTRPLAVSMGDVDGDGQPDLVSANYSDNTVSVLRNTSTAGTVGFAPKTDFATGTTPIAVSMGDVDGDGRPDLAVTNNGLVSVLRNTGAAGTVSFAARVDFVTDNSPYWVSIGDLDGDGRPDLAVATIGTNLVSVLRQVVPLVISSFAPTSGPVGTSVTITGTGFNTVAGQNVVFFGATRAAVTAAGATSLSVTVPPGTTYEYPTVTNLATALTAYARQPFVVTLSGAVAFAAKVDAATGSVPYSVSIGDVDGDGLPDLVVANSSSTTVSVLRNTSAAGTVSFAAKVDFATGTTPIAVSIGDVDGDGRPDLAVANYGSSTVSVLRNTGTAGTVSFAAKVDFAVGLYPYSVSTGDLDADGRPDLAVANSGSATVSVLRNTSAAGTVSFATKADFATGTNPLSVSMGDVDGDGRPDLAVANYGSNTVSVLRNTSAGSTIDFAAKVDFATGSVPYSVSIGDVDGDGRPDLAVANSGSSTVSVLRNTSTAGTVSFATKADFATGTSPRSVSMGDLDGDGRPDLAVGNYSSATVSVLRNTGAAGTVGFAAKADFATGTNPLSVSMGDLDGDGRPDLLAASNGSNTVSVLRQVVPVPTISSLAPTSGVAGTVVTLTGTYLTGATVVAVNGVAVSPTAVTATTCTFVVPAGASPTQSISVTTPGGPSVASTAFTVRLAVAGTSPAANARTAPPSGSAVAITFTEPVTAASAGTMRVFSAQLGGRKAGAVAVAGSTASFAATAGTPRTSFAPGEVVSVTLPAGVLGAGGLAAGKRVYQFTTAVSGPGRGDFQPGSAPAVGLNPQCLATGDVNGDGYPDVVTANYGAGTVSVRLGTGTGTFVPAPEVSVGAQPVCLALADVDGDGDLDLLVGVGSTATLNVRLNDGSGGFSGSQNVPVGSLPTIVAPGDVDGDGDLDFVVSNGSANTVSVRLNNGSGVFSAPATGAEVAVGNGPYSVALGDLDGDGDLDFATGNISANTVSVRLNDGTGGFSAPAANAEVAVAAGPNGLVLGDLDGDGDLDLAVAGSGTNVATVLRNDGTGSLGTRTDVPTGTNPNFAALGDVDGDGDLDLLTANNSGSLSVRLNNGSGTFAAPFTNPNPAVTGMLAMVVLGDVDNDGDLDALAISSSNALIVRLNQGPAPLPVELAAFTATAAGPAAVRLAWATASEKNSLVFEVERSLDGRTFGRVGTVAAAGSSSSPRTYGLLDNQVPKPLSPQAPIYYRLRQVDADGTFSYSPVRTVGLSGAAAGLALYPNPAHAGTATLTGALPGTLVTVYDALGRQVTSAPADATGTAALALPVGLPAGVYVVRAGTKAVRLTVE
ncbi:FG-GAP-like repeat-containing protein [Hymenobacter artigasi]|uniref:receptor protein-tyrosine kinase n=1 Tax=Hymenobacter artigasi TaxID=2719616 RepID=A0ABX1HC92_9BACT|nr:FG-GAP-like repeat-containing protein [Hymenobacter artigasi]NKI87815.1 hypothetical protein [Hymenobacter artigasi]